MGALRTILLLAGCLLPVIGSTSCAIDAIVRNTASLGGIDPGQRGEAEVVFENNTPYRAIFTFGAYDDLDRNTQPDLRQFSSASNTLTLEGNSESDVLKVQCARVFSVGGAGLLARIEKNLDTSTLDSAALVEGVFFSSAPVGDDNADIGTEGGARPMDAFIGVDFQCGSLLIYRLEFNDAGPEPFVVELTVVPAESTRG